MALSPLLQQTTFAQLPGWSEDNPAEAFAAFRRSALHVANKPYRNGALGVDCAAFAGAYAAALDAKSFDGRNARAFFETFFVPHRVRPDNRAKGLVTGFYEPEVEARRHRTRNFSIPFLRRPDDLVDVDDTNRPDGFDPYFAFGRKTRNEIVEYFDRQAIERGALSERGLEIAWVQSKVDAFFVHVQGAARLVMPEGVRRITYAAKAGYRFTGVGKVLADLGEIALADVTMQSIRRWLREHPDRVDEILWKNRSYIFFREAPVDDPELGPIAAAKVPLTPGRSVAVDRLLHTFGTPFFIDAPELTVFDQKPFRRLMIAQDTGSAITGPARGDLFAGSGDAAGEIAGVVRNDADFYALVPRTLLRD